MNQFNKSGFKPTTFRVLVKTDKVEEKTQGGIILPDEVKEKEQFAQSKGILVDHGYCAFRDTNKEWEDRPHIGDTVAFKAYSGVSMIGDDGDTYTLMNDEEIFAYKD